MRLTVGGDTPTLAAICLPVWRCRGNASITEYVAGAVWLGKEWGREERSRNPSTPSARKRLTHLATVLAAVLKGPGAAAPFSPPPSPPPPPPPPPPFSSGAVLFVIVLVFPC